MNFNPDDPRLTAYALGELDDISRHEIQTLVAQNPEAARLVEEIRRSGEALQAELAREQGSGLGRQRLEALMAHSQELSSPGRSVSTPVYHVLTHPACGEGESRRLLVAAGIAAAVMVLLGALTALWPTRSQPRVAEKAIENSQQNNVMILTGLLPSTQQDGALFTDGTGGAGNVIVDAHGPGPADPSPFLDAQLNPVSGFPLNVSTASYADVRSDIDAGHLPSPEAVRIEEMVNAFAYHYPAPAAGATFAADVEVAACPWDASHRLVRIGLRARDGTDEHSPVARDATARVQFNPQEVARYRLIGTVHREGNAGQTTSNVFGGETVTALYELIPVAALSAPSPNHADGAMLTLELRYRPPERTDSVSQQFAVNDSGAALEQSSEDFKFAAAVASFGMALRDSSPGRAEGLDHALALAAAGVGNDKERVQFVELVKRAREIKGA